MKLTKNAEMLQNYIKDYYKLFSPTMEKENLMFSDRFEDMYMTKISKRRDWTDLENILNGKPLEIDMPYIPEKIPTNTALSLLQNKIATEKDLKFDIKVVLSQYPLKYIGKNIEEPFIQAVEPITTDNSNAKKVQVVMSDKLSLDIFNFNTILKQHLEEIIESNEMQQAKKIKIQYGSCWIMPIFKQSKDFTEHMLQPEIKIISPDFMILDVGALRDSGQKFKGFFEMISRETIPYYVKQMIGGLTSNMSTINTFISNAKTALRLLEASEDDFADDETKLISTQIIEQFICHTEYRQNFEDGFLTVSTVFEYQYSVDEGKKVKCAMFIGNYNIGSFITKLNVIPITPLYDVKNDGDVFGASSGIPAITSQKNNDKWLSVVFTSELMAIQPTIFFNEEGLNGKSADLIASLEAIRPGRMIGVDGNPNEITSQLNISNRGETSFGLLNALTMGVSNSIQEDATLNNEFGSSSTGTATQLRINQSGLNHNPALTLYKEFISNLAHIIISFWQSNVNKTVHKEINIAFLNLDPNSETVSEYTTLSSDLFNQSLKMLINDLKFGNNWEIDYQKTLQLFQLGNQVNKSLISPMELIDRSKIQNRAGILKRLQENDEQIKTQKAADVVHLISAVLMDTAGKVQSGELETIENNLIDKVKYIVDPNTPLAAATQATETLIQQFNQQAQQQNQKGVSGNDPLRNNGAPLSANSGNQGAQ